MRSVLELKSGGERCSPLSRSVNRSFGITPSSVASSRNRTFTHKPSNFGRFRNALRSAANSSFMSFTHYTPPTSPTPPPPYPLSWLRSRPSYSLSSRHDLELRLLRPRLPYPQSFQAFSGRWHVLRHLRASRHHLHARTLVG